VHTEKSFPGVLKPDATLLSTSADNGQPDAVLIEYDRTRRPAKQLARLARYDHFLSKGWRQTRFASHAGEPAVILICATEQTPPPSSPEPPTRRSPHGSATPTPTPTTATGLDPVEVLTVLV